MDAVALARLQFGLTAAFHFLFPPLSIGLAWVIVYMGWRGLRTGDKLYEQMTRFWVKILGLIFAVGVATGIALEFQFGTNWSTYSCFVGDIFGSPLAAEGVFAFFLESVFMGVLLLGRNRVSKKFYLFSALMVAVGSTLSAFWIIVANSWQQTPVAYQIVGEGALRRAELTNFLQAVFNPSTRPRYSAHGDVFHSFRQLPGGRRQRVVSAQEAAHSLCATVAAHRPRFRRRVLVADAPDGP